MNIAILLTCHNRIEQTLICLNNLFASLSSSCISNIKVYLVDDGSTDSTAQRVHNLDKDIVIIKGSGNLFWAGGMRLAWQTAVAQKRYDFYIWLNNDTYIYPNAIKQIFTDYEEAKKKYKSDIIICGACEETKGSQIFSYGGRIGDTPILPSHKLPKVELINGNIVLVPQGIFESLGNLSSSYTHGIADYDYGMKAIANGFLCVTTSVYIAECESHKEVPKWRDPQVNIRDRWTNFWEPTGLNIKEYLIWRKSYWGAKWILFAIKAFFRFLFPNSINKRKFYHSFLKK